MFFIPHHLPILEVWFNVKLWPYHGYLYEILSQLICKMGLAIFISNDTARTLRDQALFMPDHL